jgi:hypothetical protein
MALYSVRLDEASEEALAAAARARKVSRAVILREAIAEYASVAGRASTPFARMSPLIGVIENSPGDLSEQTGKGFARLLAARREGGAARTARGSGKHLKRPSR